MMQNLVELMDGLTSAEGYAKSALDDVLLFKASKPIPTMPIIYEQSLCIAIQGRKVARTADMVLEYNPQHYLVVPTIVPFECETQFTEAEPFFGLVINLDFSVIQDVLDTMGDAYCDASAAMTPHPGMYLETWDEAMQDSVIRLLRSLKNESDAAVLGQPLVREIYYRALMGENGHILASAAKGESAYAKVAKSIRTIHDNYADPLDVNLLADTANMSVRSFHDHFKAATACTPFQYLKRVRLDRARQLLVRRGLQANVTAHMVGYESTSQFSREFKKYFGYSPRDASENFSPNLVR